MDTALLRNLELGPIDQVAYVVVNLERALPRYELPRRPNAHELAESALLVVREGAKAGITDPEVIADARFSYRRLYEQLADAQRKDLPSPDSLASR